MANHSVDAIAHASELILGCDSFSDFVQVLEPRRLFTATPTLAQVEAALTRLTTAHDTITLTQIGGTSADSQVGSWRVEQVAAPPGATTMKFKIIFENPPFEADEDAAPFTAPELAPFGAGYTFLVDAKHPLNLFAIEKTEDSESILFTAKLSSDLKKITGILAISSPDLPLDFTYVVKVR